MKSYIDKESPRCGALRLAGTPPVEWRSMVEEPLPSGRTDSEWLDIASGLESDAVRLLLLSEYIKQRRGEYCGNHSDHDDAAKAVKRLHLSLRRALGYTIPKRDCWISWDAEARRGSYEGRSCC